MADEAKKAWSDWANGEWTNPDTHCAGESLDCVPDNFSGTVLKIPAYGTKDAPILYLATSGSLKPQE